MAELDVIWSEVRIGSDLHGYLLSEADLNKVRIALEDRDRLREAIRRAIERTNTMHPWTHDDGTVLSLHLFPEDYDALRAALEGRDG